MKSNRDLFILAVTAIAAIAILKYMLKSSVPYVPFSAAAAKGEYVQIIGSIDKKRGIVLENKGIAFTLTDSTGSINIIYNAEKPPQMEAAEKVVVMGQYNKSLKLFEADKILTKCPSKYENKPKQ